jgi:outer membrane lipoprotein-sorting protein
MGQLGELLELMATARSRYQTVSATLYERFDHRIAWRDEEASGYGHETVGELFVAQPDRARIERRAATGGLELLVVLDGGRRSTYSPDWGARVDEQERGDVREELGAAAELLDPMPLIGTLEMTSIERGSRNGREVFHVSAIPRFPLPPSLGSTDREELVVDAERGVVLELVGWIGRSPARTLELRDVQYDLELDPDAFEFTLPPEEEVSGLGLRDAASLASFPLWALPRPAQQITYRSARPDRGRSESVTLEYTDVLLVETSAADGAAFTWMSSEPPIDVRRGRRSYTVLPGRAYFVLEGTTIQLASENADDEQLLDLAEALVRLD